MSNGPQQWVTALLGLLIVSALVIGAGITAISQSSFNLPTVAYMQSVTSTLKIVMLTMMTPTQTNETESLTETPTMQNFPSQTSVPQESEATPSPTKTDLPTIAAIQCYTPPNWVTHVVQPGENLYRIGLKYRIDTTALQKGNCMGSSTTIIAGQQLWVPNVATSTPETTPTSTPNLNNTAVATQPINGTETAKTETISSTNTTETQQTTQLSNTTSDGN